MIHDIKEVPYAIYDKNLETESDEHNLPVSVEVTPHKAILVGVVEYRNKNMCACKFCIVFFTSIPLLLLFISLLLRD
jgi:hypothetical protein